MALFTTARIWEQPKCPSMMMGREDVYVYIVGRYLVIKRNEIASFVVMWVDLETVIRRNGEKNKCILMHMYGI